jgi:hypothetical protein
VFGVYIKCTVPVLFYNKWLNELTELQPPLSGVHSVMRVKLVLAGVGGGARPPPFTTITITSKVAVFAPAEWADTLTLSHLYQYMYVRVLCELDQQKNMIF